MIFVGDATGAVSPVLFKSCKALRVTRSVFMAELIAFCDMFDASFTLSEELRCFVPVFPIPVNLYTNSKTLFDIRGSRTSEKRFMLDIACDREVFKKNEISHIGFIRSSDNIAGGITKPMTQQFLVSTIASGKLDVNVEQWIISSSPE